MNMIDYIGWRGDITFEEKGLNDIDNLIFSELAYMDLKDILSLDGSDCLTIEEIYDAYTAKGVDQSHMMNDPLPVLRKAALSERFRHVRARWYYDDVDADRQIQFAAITFLYREDESYIAFRGTDNTLIGWRECFNMSYLSETPGQSGAVMYLNRIADQLKGSLYIGGHSKGGNFAVYASAFCDEAVRDRIVKVFSNDGPGFLSEVADSENYIAAVPKIRKFVPDSSLVGALLSDRVGKIIIKSSVKGFTQHDPYTWNVIGPRFEQSEERTAGSVILSDTMRRWLSSLSDDNKRIFVDSLFNALDEAGVKNVRDLGENRLSTYHAIIKAVSKLDTQTMADFQNTLKMLVKTGTEVALNNQKH